MKKNQYEKEQPRRRFNEKTDGEMVRKYFAEMPTAELARMLGLEPYADYSVETAAKRITRAQCLDMNEYAADLANITLKCNEQDEEGKKTSQICSPAFEEM